LTGHQNRLFADHTFSLNYNRIIQRVFYVPKTRDQLHDVFALICNFYGIGKCMLSMIVPNDVTFVFWGNGNLDATSYLLYHIQRIAPLQVTKWNGEKETKINNRPKNTNFMNLCKDKTYDLLT